MNHTMDFFSKLSVKRLQSLCILGFIYYLCEKFTSGRQVALAVEIGYFSIREAAQVRMTPCSLTLIVGNCLRQIDGTIRPEIY